LPLPHLHFLRSARGNDAPAGAAPSEHDDKILIVDLAESLDPNFSIIVPIILTLGNTLFPEPRRKAEIKAATFEAVLTFGFVPFKIRSTPHLIMIRVKRIQRNAAFVDFVLSRC